MKQSGIQVQSVELYTGEGRVKVNEYTNEGRVKVSKLYSSTPMGEGLRLASCIQVHQCRKG